jgi:hypothetical protein
MCPAIPGKALQEFESGGMRMAKVQFGARLLCAAVLYETGMVLLVKDVTRYHGKRHRAGLVHLG